MGNVFWRTKLVVGGKHQDHCQRIQVMVKALVFGLAHCVRGMPHLIPVPPYTLFLAFHQAISPNFHHRSVTIMSSLPTRQLFSLVSFIPRHQISILVIILIPCSLILGVKKLTAPHLRFIFPSQAFPGLSSSKNLVQAMPCHPEQLSILTHDNLNHVVCPLCGLDNLSH